MPCFEKFSFLFKPFTMLGHKFVEFFRIFLTELLKPFPAMLTPLFGYFLKFLRIFFSKLLELFFHLFSMFLKLALKCLWIFIPKRFQLGNLLLSILSCL